MTTEQELREALDKFGMDVDVLKFKSHDRVNLYPRQGNIHKMQLDLRYHLKDVEIEAIMKHALSESKFKLWQTSAQSKLALDGNKAITEAKTQ